MSDFAITTKEQEDGMLYTWTATYGEGTLGDSVLVTDGHHTNPSIDKKVRELLEAQYERSVQFQECKKTGHKFVDSTKIKGFEPYEYCQKCHTKKEEQ